MSHKRRQGALGASKVHPEGSIADFAADKSHSLAENSVENLGATSSGLSGLKSGCLSNDGGRVAGVIGTNGKHLHGKPSFTAELDGLLAEGKAAADILSASERLNRTSDGTSSPDPSIHPARGYDKTKPSATSINLHKHASVKELGSPYISSATHVKNMSIASHHDSEAPNGEDFSFSVTEGQPSRRSTHHGPHHREIRLCEPPESIPVGSKNFSPTHKALRQSIMEGMQPPQPAVQSPRVSEFEHEFLQLERSEVQELREWLQLTGYYDEEYRSKSLRRRKRLAALELERAKLIKEEQDAREALERRNDASFPTSHFKLDVNDTFPGGHGSPHLTSANSMPQTPKGAEMIDRTPSINLNDGSVGDPGRDATPGPFIHPSRELKLKRSSSIMASPPQQSMKKLRMERWNKHTEDQDDPDAVRPIEQSRTAFFEKPQQDTQQHDFSTTNQPGGWGDIPESRGYGGSVPSRGRGRGLPPMRPRGGGPSQSTRSQYVLENPRMILGAGGRYETKFFILKSLSLENVIASQHEGTWSTQVKNIDKLVDAYNSARHVVLFFSVNHSKAFQGFACMESLPGDPDVPIPRWADSYNWEPSPPFRVRWINTAVTSFKQVAHLTNAYNDNMLVFVGRDGQEIEPRCGLELCSILDRSGTL
ncbi:YT521-B-like family protein [Coccidioides posadasii C735 delta SOWgp]|uniref:YT521-B-like family protein n=1 Tax=Coccidioides posadasii (strain C735) TaxID=222929 RepID=C5PGA6_COCP7|nr:YT521-B-like family protein [Coccidioides posadasii C735 delta SOWgp]EER23559.1 YT521-B-like family protein [Coccidioides posadasii C735 delta SOWgp]|eukprot:XP_003065704.1 YT521-B-like family protein [Coccidioides posadasii C735 delta SOWgp]